MLRFHLCLQQDDKIPKGPNLAFLLWPSKTGPPTMGRFKSLQDQSFNASFSKRSTVNGYPIYLIGGSTNLFETYQSNQNCIIYMQLGVKVQEVFETTT